MSVSKEEMTKQNKPSENKPQESPIAEARPVTFSVSPAEKEVKVKAEDVGIKLHLWLR
jgi:hypothetical protein